MIEFFSVCSGTNQGLPYGQRAMCRNGGTNLEVGCVHDFQCAPYSIVPTACLDGCCCTVPQPPATTHSSAANTSGNY